MNSEELTEVVMEVVIHFQDLLHGIGFPVVFDQSLLRQVEGALSLLEHCEWDADRARGLCELYCAEDWWPRHQPHLDMVARRAEHLEEQHPAPYLMGLTWESL